MLIEDFGDTILKVPVKLYTLENQNKMQLKVMNIGATMVSLLVKDKTGKIRDVILGYDNAIEYQKQTNCFGATIGRNANRVAVAKCNIDGQAYHLEKNDNSNNLHCGSNGFHNVIWDAEVEENRNDTITFTYYSKDMEQGFPGNMTAKVTYTLTNNDELKIDYFGETDKTTVANFTNHAYYNLGGHDFGSIGGHKLRILAKQYTPFSSAEAIPTGKFEKVAGTPLDFWKEKTMAVDKNQNFIQLKYGNGYNHNYVLDTIPGNMKLAAQAFCEESGIAMDLYTDTVGIQFYDSSYMEKHLGKGGVVYDSRHGFCLEPQFHPNAVNEENFASPILKPGEIYQAHTKVSFFIR